MTDIAVFLLGESSSGATQVVRGQGASMEVVHDYGRLSTEQASGLAVAKFDPALDALPWRQGDILVAVSSSSRSGGGRRIERIREDARTPGRYNNTEIWSENTPTRIRSLALDNNGDLYFSVEGARAIWKLRSTGVVLKRGRPSLQAGPWAMLPSDFEWAGDFAFAPDGALVVGTGIGANAAALLKFDLSSDPPPSTRFARADDHAPLFAAKGVIRGLSFYAPDQAVFADGYEALSVTVDPALDPTSPSPGSGSASPRMIWEHPGFFARDVDVARVEWDDFIQERPLLQTAISWTTHTQLSPYPNWGNEAQTRPMRRVLHRMYGWLGSGKPAPLSYLGQVDANGNPRIGPEVVIGHTISTEDAQELYLAHLAMQLWVAVKQQTPWGLDDYDAAALELLFQGERTFKPTWVNGVEMHYADAGTMGIVMPDEPLAAYRFIVGESPFSEDPSMIRQTARETVLALAQFVLDHVFHGPGFGATPQENFQRWGYEGYAPLATMCRRTLDPTAPIEPLRFRAWNGCQSATGLMVLLSRLALVPAQRLTLYEWDFSSPAARVHAGIDFPTEQLAAAHTDDFFATTALSSQTIAPTEIFNGVPTEDYFQYISLPMFTLPANQTDGATNWAEHLRTIGRIAARTGTIELMERLWADISNYAAQTNSETQPDGPCDQIYTRTLARLRGFELTNAEAIAVLCPAIADHWAVVDAFMTAHDAELSGTPAIRYQQGWQLYLAEYTDWFEAR